MKRIVLAVRDLKAEVFMPSTFTALTLSEAERTFVSIVDQQGSTINQYPKDFALYEVGTWDDMSGQIFPLTVEGSIVPPRLMLTGEQVVNWRKAERKEA